jgi:3-hydroxyisobutyrate dehydrogenase
MKIGFIGFGSLGTAIVKNLLSKNYEIVGWNRTKEKLFTLPIEQAATPREVIQNTDIVILNLFDSVAVDEVLNGSNGLLPAEINGKIIIDTTTNHFEEVLKFHSLMESKGGSYLEAPVLGSVVPASQGMLTILVSGKKEAYDRANSILNSIGKTIYFLEEPGLATKMKLVNNLVLGSFMATIAEAVVLGESVGIEKEKVLEILSNGAGNSGVLNAKKEKILREDFAPHFSIAAIKKDIVYLMELKDDVGLQSLLGDAVNRMLDLAISNGFKDSDISSLYATLKRE